MPARHDASSGFVCQLLALIERFMQLLDRQLAGVKLTLSPNRRTVTVDPNRPSVVRG
jgi:hypothetical protein